MTMYFFTFLAVPTPDAKEFLDSGGAYVNCWIQGDDRHEAERRASALIDEYGWSVEALEEGATVTSAVNRLEAQGFVERRPHPSDRRTTLAVITDEGRDIVERATEVLNREVFADIGLGEREVDLVGEVGVGEGGEFRWFGHRICSVFVFPSRYVTRNATVCGSPVNSTRPKSRRTTRSASSTFS